MKIRIVTMKCSFTWVVHAMTRKTGATNAMVLPKVIAFNAKDETARKRYGAVVDHMGIAKAEF